MPDIFISYKSSEREEVARIVAALREEGFSVWWDHHLLGGTDYSEVIETEIAKARIVIPVWSEQSIQSQWVRAEAERAQGKLLPIRIDPVSPPLPHNKLHTVDLCGWRGDRDDPRWRRLIEDAHARMGGGTDVQRAEVAPRRGQTRILLFAAAALVALVVLSATIFRGPIQTGVTPDPEASAATSAPAPAAPASPGAIGAAAPEGSPVEVSLCAAPRADACGLTSVAVGQLVYVRVQAARAGRLVLIDKNAAGVQTQIFPNGITRASAEVRMEPGVERFLPEDDHGFSFVAAEPLGPGALSAFLWPAERPLPAPIERNRRTRGIAVVPDAATVAMDAEVITSEVATAEFAYTVVASGR